MPEFGALPEPAKPGTSPMVFDQMNELSSVKPFEKRFSTLVCSEWNS